MIIAGLTGSIGMGKTTAAAMFKDAGAAIFDADAAVHNLYAKGGAAVPIIRAGLPTAITDGAVDRAKLSAIIAKDPLQLTVLESFVHPLVEAMRKDKVSAAKASGKKVFIFDMPILFETGGQDKVDVVIVVSAPAEMQRARVLARPGMSAEKFEFILSRQMPDAEKRARADYVINSGKGMEFARKQVQAIMQDLKNRA